MKEYYYVISVKHTKRSDRYITLWGPDNAGYRLRLNTSGLYPEERVRANIGYYNSGCDAIAVPRDVVERLATEGNPADFVGADPCLPPYWVLFNTADVWWELILNTIEPPPYRVEPVYPIPRRRKVGA